MALRYSAFSGSLRLRIIIETEPVPAAESNRACMSRFTRSSHLITLVWHELLESQINRSLGVMFHTCNLAGFLFLKTVRIISCLLLFGMEKNPWILSIGNSQNGA